MRDEVDLFDQVEALEAMIDGIHNARASHRILSMVATRTDSVLLARAALDALHAAGLLSIGTRAASGRNGWKVDTPEVSSLLGWTATCLR